MIKRTLIFISVLMMCLGTRAQAQFFDPNTSLILGTLREISLKHNLGLQEQRMQTAQLVQQVKQFYDTYTLLRNDLEFTQSLYQDMKSAQDLDLSNAYAVSNFIINGDRVNFWLPRTSSDVNRTALDAEALLGNARELERIYDSFAISTQDDEVPSDIVQRRENALLGQDAFSRALVEQAIRDQQLAKDYYNEAIKLRTLALDPENKFTEAERTQFMIEALKLQEKSNAYYEKYLKLSQEAHTNELEQFDRKMDFLGKRFTWKALKSHINQTSKIRYGFFDISAARTE